MGASLATNDSAVITTQLQRYSDVSLITVPPEPAVIARERGLEAAFAGCFATTSLVGYILTTRMRVKVKVDPPPVADHA